LAESAVDGLDHLAICSGEMIQFDRVGKGGVDSRMICSREDDCTEVFGFVI